MTSEVLGRAVGEALNVAGDLSGANFIRKAAMGEEMHPAIVKHHMDNFQNSFSDGRLDTAIESGKEVATNAGNVVTSIPDGSSAVVESGSDFFDSVGDFVGSILDLF